MKLRELSPAAIYQKRVLVRVDFNVPLATDPISGKTTVTDANRIIQALDTIRFLQAHQAKVILISHLGRPLAKSEGGGEVQASLKPVADELSSLLNQPVRFLNDCVGANIIAALKDLQPSEVAMLENVRFHEEEQKNDQQFSEQLAALAEVYVNEAFSASHRKHASIVGIPKFLPSYAGIGLAKEVAAFDKIMHNPERPFVMIVGGAKISDKVSAIEHLAKIADAVLIGGGVANNFLKAEGFDIQKSYLQDVPADLQKKGVDYVTMAEKIIEDAKQNRLVINDYIPLAKILYPTDVIAAPAKESTEGDVIDLINQKEEGSVGTVGSTDGAQTDQMYLDIGPQTTKLYEAIIARAKTIFWNGPMGLFENPAFNKGTESVAVAVANATATTILGGGDTIAAIQSYGLSNRYDYISTAGSAALSFLAGQELPGLTPLQETP